MKKAPAQNNGFQEILLHKEAELARVLRVRDGIVIETSADQMDEVQYASERELAIRNADKDSALLRQVRSALQRIRDGSFGTCIDCEWAISPKRLAAVPWASRCIECQNAVEQDQQGTTESLGDPLVEAA
jgi:DnaK suppressor protein